MTQGLIVVRDGKKTLLAVYLRSDAYFSMDADSHCAAVVRAFKNGDFVDSIRAEYAAANSNNPTGIVEGYENITRANYVRTAKNRNNFFYDYVYEYDARKDSLTIYEYGDRAIAFTREQIPYMEYLFVNYYDKIDALGFDFDKLDFSGKECDIKTFEALMNGGASVSEIDAKVKAEAARIQVVIEEGRISDWKPENIKKRVFLYDGYDGSRNMSRAVYFILDYDKYSPRKPYTLYIQTPTCRMCVDPVSRSKKAALARLVELCKDSMFVTNLKRAAKVFYNVETVSNEVSAFRGVPRDEQAKIKDALLGKLDALWKNADDSPLGVCKASEKGLYKDIYDEFLGYCERLSAESEKTA